MRSMRPVTFSVHNALTQWGSGPFVLCALAVLIGVAYLYLQGDWRLAARGRRWPARRTASFMAGLVAVDLALQSPIATFTGSYFQAHVVQHLLLMIVAPPLLALGAPSTLFLQTANRKNKTRWLGLLHSRPFAAITHPISVWALYFGFMFLFFLTSLIDVAMLHMALMDLINIVFLLGGCLYWWPMIGLDPILHWKMGYGARMVNVLIGAVPETLLGIAIMSQSNPIASMYSLASTHSGGGMLWASTEFGTLAAFVPIFLQWMRSEERVATRADVTVDDSPQRQMSVLENAKSKRGPASDGEMAVTLNAPTDSSARKLSVWEATWLARAGSIPVVTSGGLPDDSDDSVTKGDRAVIDKGDDHAIVDS